MTGKRITGTVPVTYSGYIWRADMNKNFQVFISYRRDGGETLGRMLYDRLNDMGYSVFYDVESLRSGPFNSELFEVIDGCADVLVVLPPGGLDRCEDPKDWVRAEIAYALKSQKNVIPVMMRGFKFDEEKMPDDIRQLANLNGIEANMELFPAVMEKLTQKLMKSKPQRFRHRYSGTGRSGSEGIDSYELPRSRIIILTIFELLLIFAPPLLRRYYVEQDFWPGWVNRCLMCFKNMPWWEFILFYVLGIVVSWWLINSSFILKHNLSSSDVLKLSDIDQDIDGFISRLLQIKALGDLIVLDSANISEEAGYKWSAEAEGIKILSYGGERPDYLLLKYTAYRGRMQPLYLTSVVTVSSISEFMQAQGFSLEWQKDGKTCYRNGEWKLLLYFGGFVGGLLVMELMRGEHPSELDRAVEEAERQTVSGSWKHLFDEKEE